MKPILSLYLRLFLFMGIPFGLITLLIDVISGEGFVLRTFLFRVLFFGGSMAATLGTLHVLKLRFQGVQEFTPGNLSVRQRRIVKSKVSLQNLIDLIKEDPDMGNIKVLEKNNAIVLQTSSSWRSGGEKIFITINSDKDSINEYEILSRPRINTTLVDAGKNFENVTRIEKLLKTVD
ncbi:MAG TPA: hypothetical protein VMZ69_01140 [Saprospiraceae bacterium]|nr:hypothetical protein [Saprospiraceae bacterium]